MLPRGLRCGDPWKEINTFFLREKCDSVEIYYRGPGFMNMDVSTCNDLHKSKLKVVKQFHRYILDIDRRRSMQQLDRSIGVHGYSDRIVFKAVTWDDTEDILWTWITSKMNDGVKPKTLKDYVNYICWHAMVLCGFSSTCGRFVPQVLCDDDCARLV